MDVGLFGRLSVALAIGGAVAWLAGVLLVLSASSVNAAVVLRTVFTVLMVVLLTRILVRRTAEGAGIHRAVLAGAVLSYLLFVPTWAGRALIAQLALDPGVLSAVIDGLVWVAVVVVAARTVQPEGEPELGYASPPASRGREV